MATTTNPRSVGRAASSAVAIVLVLVTANQAAAAVELVTPATEVHHGACDDRSTWRFSIRPGRQAGWRLRLELHTPHARQSWTILFSRNGAMPAAREWVSDDLGDVLARRGGRDGPGPDRFRFAAVNEITGETCTGRLAVDRGL